MKKSHHHSRAGFTLAEILLAMLVFAIAISTILALLARSIETADEILLKNEAIDLSSALDSYLSEQPFTEVYDIVRSGGFVYAYQYRGDLDESTYQNDGSLAPYTLDANSELGQDYTITPAIRDPDVTSTPQLEAEDLVREGRLFHIKLIESPANPYSIENGGVGNLPTDPNGSPFYDSAVLVMLAEFYPIPAIGVPPGPEPVFSFNLAVRR